MENDLIELKASLQNKNYEEKLEIVSNILCDEWYLIEHKEFIKQVLNISYKA